METKNEYLSVKVFAEMAGISTQRVYQLLAKDLQGYCKVFNNTKFIHTSALERFNPKPTVQQLQEDLPNDFQSLTKSLQDQIATLQQHNELLSEQLKVKDSQLAEKDKQIAALTTNLQTVTETLATAQALHAGTIQQQLVDKVTVSDVEPVEEPTMKKTKKGFFTRIFGGK